MIFSKHPLCLYSYMDAPLGHWLSVKRKSLTAIAQGFYKLFLTNSESNITQNRSCTATYLPSLKTSHIRWTRHVRYCWRIKDKLIWAPSHGHVSVGRPARTYLQQLCTDIGCSLEDLLYDRWFGLVCWVLWHINLCRLFNAKSIFM